jgi:acetyltransferase-like isoleucine patch superfamily enzyme
MIEEILLNIKRGETPLYRRLGTAARSVASSNLPIPRFFYPVLRTLFNLHTEVFAGLRWLASYFYYEPLFRSRCESVGKSFRISRLPFVVGHTHIHIGNNVNFFGQVDIFSGRMFDHPTLILKDRVDIGHNVVFVVNREIIIEEDVNVASGVRFMDSDAHPRDTAERIADLPPRPEEIKPVRVGRYAWIGQNAFILKGVTIGEGAVIGVNSVVVTDIPAYCVAMGNPARVVVKNVGRPVESPSNLTRPGPTNSATES